MISRRVARLLAVLTLASVVPACSLGDDKAVKVSAPPADERAVAGGELRVGIVRPSTLDPQLLHPADSAGALVVRTMCDPLIGTDPDTRELQPALAKDWQVLSGGTSVQVELRAGLKFSDGSEVTARDVVAAIQRVVDPATVSPSVDFVEHIFGYADVRDDKTEPDSLRGVGAISGDTMQIGLDRADSQWVHALTLPFAIPVPRSAARRPGFSNRPVCSGPYRLAADYTGTENEIRLVRTPGYEGTRPSLTRAGQGWADRVTFKIYPTRAAAFAALRAGAVDTAQLASRDIPGATVAGMTVLSVTTGRMEYVGLPRVEPFDNPLVKVALSAALDRDRLNNAAFLGSRAPAVNLVPPTLPESLLPEERAVNCTPDGTPLSLDDARGLLQRAKADLNGTTLPFYYNDEFDNAAMVAELARQWKAAFGLTLQPRKVTFEALLARGRSVDGFDGFFRMAATAEFPDIAEFVLPLIDRNGFGTTNLTGFDGELLTRRLELDAMVAIDPADQRTEYFPIVLNLCGVPVVPVAWYRSHLALSAKVVVAGNDGVDRLTGMPELRELAVG